MWQAAGGVEMLKGLLMSLEGIVRLILGIFCFYYFIISTFGWFKRSEIPCSDFPPANRFAILIAAHDEEKVIGKAVHNLKSLDYPQNMFDVFVVADNCGDATAKIARENGARVYERFNAAKRGKGYSIDWMLKKLFDLDERYDAVCVFDADNLASPNFLKEMNKRLMLGDKVIQGYLDSKNPEDTWISASYSISYWLSDRLFQLPRHYLGLSCTLGGTGFTVATGVLKELGWGTTSLTEDLEFSLKLVLRGMKVHWAHEAVVYDEKPLGLKQSCRQRKRWMQGHFDCAFRYMGRLLRRAFKERDFVAADMAVYLLQPFILVINSVFALIDAASAVLAVSAHGFKPSAFLASFLLIAFISALNIYIMLDEKKLTGKILAYFAVFTFYGLTWVPVIIQGFLDRNRKEWVHTPHTRAIDINDIRSFKQVG